jgi:trehalose synthase
MKSLLDPNLRKSVREGFGLTIAEAMWKAAAVIGGSVGGIRYRIKDGENGFLVSSVKDAAERIVQLVKNNNLREQLGKKARGSVKKRFLEISYDSLSEPVSHNGKIL